MASAVLLKSIGCRTNQEEMVALGSLLARAGYNVVDTLDRADIVVVNTCLVTSGTEAKTRRYISALARSRPGVKVCVTGCLAQHSPSEIKKRLPVTWVVGNTHKQNIPAIIKGEDGIFHGDVDLPKAISLSLVTIPVSPDALNRTRFFLKIQEGCNFRCTYCVVPLVRGPSACYQFSEVKAAFVRALDSGFREIVLTGTHIGQYADAQHGSFEDCVEKLADIKGDFRIRLSSLDPRDLSHRLLEMIGSHPRLCRHLHLSVQSLCADVLEKMGRPVPDFDGFIAGIASFRRSYPSAGLGGDFIVGFPSETDRQFDETCAAAVATGFCYGHVFRYSKRPGTPAVSMPGHIEEKAKTLRSARLRELLESVRKGFVESLIGQHETLLVEKESPASGLASNYLRIDVPRYTAAKNSWVRVVIRGTNPVSGRCEAEIAGEQQHNG
jgi:threonylcarbamoyladenosine tRNA methylthiotransferase MtaB